MKYSALIFKRKVESLVMLPFIIIGRMAAIFLPKKNHDIYFFFPFYHAGGAERVHLQIVKATGTKNSVIFFTKKSDTKSFLEEFAKTPCVIKDISRYTDNKWLYFLNIIFRGIISGYINSQSNKPLVFNGQSNFGYKISPWIKKGIPQIELIHALNTFSLIRIPFIEFYTKSVTVSQEIIDKHKPIYKKYNIPERLFDKFTYIALRIKLPLARLQEKDVSQDEKILLYVGRSSYEKRPHIVSTIARKLNLSGVLVRAVFAGDVESKIPTEDKPFCNFLGEISDEQTLRNVYLNSHLLLISSSTESGPLVFMEGMANGLAIISTPVGYIPLHIKNGVSGFVTRNLEDDGKVVDEMADYITQLINNPALLKKIADHNIEYAYAHFDQKKFDEEYRQLFRSMK